MADSSMTFSNTLMQPGGEDFMHEFTEFMLNRIRETYVTQRINAECHQRSGERETDQSFRKKPCKRGHNTARIDPLSDLPVSAVMLWADVI